MSALQIVSTRENIAGGDGEPTDAAIQDGGVIDLNGEHLQSILSKIPPDMPVSILSIVGAFRTGKSFMFAFFLRYLRYMESKRKTIVRAKSPDDLEEDVELDYFEDWMVAESNKLSEGNLNKVSSTSGASSNGSLALESFAWKGGSERVTTGIWMWSEPFIVESVRGGDIALLLMDTQGMFDNETSMALTSQIFGLSTLVSSHLIFNVDKHIGEDNLQSLALFSEYGRIACDFQSSRANAESSSTNSGANSHSVNNNKAFQSLQFLIRDYQNFDVELDESFYDDKLSSKRTIVAELDRLMEKYLESVLPSGGDFNESDLSPSGDSELRLTRFQIRRCFQQIDCFMLPYPGPQVTKKTFDGTIAKIDPFFRVMLTIYIKKLFAQLQPKIINNRTVTASEMQVFFKEYVAMFKKIDDESSLFPNAQSLLEATAEANNSNALQLSINMYKQIVSKECKDNVSIPAAQFAVIHDTAYRRACFLFNSMATIGRQDAIDSYRTALEKAIEDEKQKYQETNALRNPYKDLAALAYLNGKYDAALLNFNESLRVTKAYFGFESNEVAQILSSIAGVQDKQGKLSAALDSYFKALEVKKKVLGEPHPEVAELYSKIGHVFTSGGNYDDALSNFRTCMKMYQSLYGDVNILVANANKDVAMILEKQGKYILSIEKYTQSLDVQKELLGKDHFEIATTLSSIALLNYNNGKSKIAIEYFNEALRIREIVFGRDSPAVCDTLSNIACIYSKTAEQFESFGKYSDALENYKSSLCITEGLLGHENLEVAKLLSSIAGVQDKLKQFELALESYNECLRIRESLLGHNNEEVADTFSNMASLCEKEMKFEVALVILNESLRIKQVLWGREHLSVAAIYTRIGGLYESQKDYENALVNYSESLRIKKTLFADGANLTTADTLVDIASVCYKQGKEEGAIQILNDALRIRRHVLGREHVDVAKILNRIAKIYENQAHYEAAIHCYNEDLRIKKIVLNSEHEDIKDTIIKIKQCQTKLTEKMTANDKVCIIS